MTQDYSFTTNAPAFRAILFALISVFSTKTFLLLWVFFSLRNFWYGAAALRVASTANLFTGPCERIRSLLRKDGRVEENFIEKHNLRFLRLYKGLKIECLFFKFQTHKTRMGCKWHKKQRADVMSLSTKKKKKSVWEGAPTFGSIGFIYRPLSSENMTFFALPAFPRRLCACCAKKRSFSSTKPPSASKINSSGICSCSCSFSSSFSSCL